MTGILANDDQSTPIHWAHSKMAARGNLFYIFSSSVRIAECWNQQTADLLVTGLRQLSDCQRPAEFRPQVGSATPDGAARQDHGPAGREGE